MMKLNAVAVSAKVIRKSVEFYKILGFKFNEFKDDEQHVEAIPQENGVRLMIDSLQMLKDILGEIPTHGNHSSFALEFDTPEELNEVAAQLIKAGFPLEKEPWDAFWGQRYAVAKDPDGYMIDLYARIST